MELTDEQRYYIEAMKKAIEEFSKENVFDFSNPDEESTEKLRLDLSDHLGKIERPFNLVPMCIMVNGQIMVTYVPKDHRPIKINFVIK